MWTAVAGGWLATNAIECWFANICKLVAGSHNSMVDPPKSITTYLTYHDSAMTLSMFNYIEIRESFGAPNPKPARFSAASYEGAFPRK